MKQATLLKLIISIVLCYLQQTALAQSKWQFGVYAGGNVSKLKPGELSKYANFGNIYKWTPSYNFGANINLMSSKRFYFESGFNIISKKSQGLSKIVKTLNMGYFNNGAVKYYDKNYNGEMNYKSMAFQIPLSIHFLIVEKKDFKTNIYGGILWENMYSNILSPIITIEYLPNIPPQEALDQIDAFEKKTIGTPIFASKDPAFSTSNIGSLFGFGCSYKKIGFDVGMNNPIRNYTSVQYKNSSITFNVRYQIK